MKRNKNIAAIDLNVWTTQQKKADTIKTRTGKGSSRQYISKLIKSGALKSWRIEELGLTLVEK